jgi:hypothetical protein
VAGIDLVGVVDTIKAAAIVMLLVIMIPRHLSRRWPTRQVGCAIDSRPGLARQSSCRPIHAIGRGRPRSQGEGRCVGRNRPVVRPCGSVPRRVGRRDVSCDIWLSAGRCAGEVRERSSTVSSSRARRSSGAAAPGGGFSCDDSAAKLWALGHT